MKKSLSLLVAIAMVFSMFASVASADTQSNYDVLAEAGIFKGFPNGDAGLDKEMTRAEYAAVIARAAGLHSDEVADFSDVSANHWAAKDINAVVEAGYMEGTGNGFNPAGKVTLQEMLTIAARMLNLEESDAEVEGKVADWAKGYVAAAIEAGLFTAQADYTVNATRGNLVDATFAVYSAIQEEEQAAAATAKAVGAKKIEVAFNKAIDDTKAKFAVKNGIITRDVAKVTVSEDKKSVVLELTTKLQKGDTVVTISGVEATDLEAKFTAEDEKVTQIKFKSDKLRLASLTNYNEVKVDYQILNQYGEEVSNVGNPTVMVGKATTSIVASNGVLTVQTASSNPFYLGESVVVSGHLNLTTYVVTFNETLTVGQPSQLDSVEFKGVYHADNKELNTGSTFSDFVLLVEAKDQYGNKLNAAALTAGAQVTTSNPSIFQIGAVLDNQGAGKDQVGIRLAAPAYTPGFDGTNTVRIMSYNGKQFTFDVPVTKAATVAKIQLSAPAQVVANNDGSVKIPFVAEDQNGNQLKKYSDLNGKITLWAQSGSFNLKQDYTTKEAYLEYTLPTGMTNTQAIPVMLMATVTGTASSSSVTLQVEKAYVPESIFGLKDVVSELAVDATVGIETKHVVVKDSYGRDKKLDDIIANYKIVFEAADSDGLNTVVASPDAELTSASDKVTFTAAAKGSERIKVKLVRLSDNAVIYTYEGFIFNVIDSGAITEYAVTDVAKMSNAAGHEVDLKVTGKRSNGTTVSLPTSAYTVAATNGITFNSATGKLNAVGATGFDSTGQVKATVKVFIKATAQEIVKEVVVSNEPLKVTSFEQRNALNLTAENGIVKGSLANLTNGGNVVANVFATIKVKDQFGVEVTGATVNDFTVTIANKDDVNKNSLVLGEVANGQSGELVNVTNVEQGDSFTLIFVSETSGASFSVRVVAE